MRRFVLCLAAALALTACSVTAPPEPISPTAAPETTTHAAQTVAAPDIADDPPLTLYPRFDDTPLLQDPETAAPRLDLLDARSRLVRFKRRGEWGWVMDASSGRIGWIENRLLTTSPPPEPPTPGKGTISETF